MKRTKLQTALSKIAPHISIHTIWEHDPYCQDITKECDMPPETDSDDRQGWQSEVRATCIQDGDEVTGSAYLGGTWEKAGDLPEDSNPTISGYEPDMTKEALQELQERVTDESLSRQIDAALDYLASTNFDA